MKTLNIRMAGLGGQGVVTAAHILGTAVVAAGKYAVVNPFFGAEKRLAPTESYVRISTDKIYDRGEILYPDIIMIFAPQVITLGKSYTMPFYSGMRRDGLVIVNSADPIIPEKEKAGLDAVGAKTVYVPATRLAVEFAGTDLATNMTMVGALCSLAAGIVPIEAVLTAAGERFGGKDRIVASGTTAALDEAIKSKFEKTAAMIEKNAAAIREAYGFVR